MQPSNRYRAVAKKTKDLLKLEYETEWDLFHISNMVPPGYRTPLFSPISGIDAKFCFEVLYQINKFNGDCAFSLLKVMLKKNSSDSISSSIKFQFEIEVKYSDDTLYKTYKSSPELTLADWSSEECIQDISPLEEYSPYFGYYDTSHGTIMKSDKLILKCRMKYSGHLHSVKMFDEKLSSANNLSQFAGNFSNLLSSGALSDVTIQAGEKYIPAHKCVLAAHCSGFKRSLEQISVKTAQDTIVISDFQPEIVESFLKFLYSAEIKDESFSSVKKLYTLANKYDVEILRRECVMIIIKSFLNMGNICEVLRIAFEFDDKDLKKAMKIYAAKKLIFLFSLAVFFILWYYFFNPFF